MATSSVMKMRAGLGLGKKIEISFRERALAEAARYGSDSWVFLRELLQNARDAGARRVQLTVTEEGEEQRLVCRDDGSGMSSVHAHRYLFALYASSKEGDARQAGQFGVGFWSVLRFKPEKVIIRSRTPHGDAWQVELDHRLDNAVFTSCEMTVGTEIILERRRRRHSLSSPSLASPSLASPSRPSRRSLEDKVHEAVYRYGRFLTCREGAPGPWRRPRRQSLQVFVNQRSVSAAMELPAPSLSFRRGGFRGVVALGAEPRVELFSNGLFVRQAACLEDLLDDASQDDAVGRSTLDLPGSLAPRILLDSNRLELLLARSDVRQSRHLQRLVKTARRELECLIERQLDVVRPRSWFLPRWIRLREWAGRLGAWRKSGAGRLKWLPPVALTGILLGWAMAGLTRPGAYEAPASVASPDQGPFRRLLHDLGKTYQGPRVDPRQEEKGTFALTYEPAARALLLTALVVEDPSSWPSTSDQGGVSTGPYQGQSCVDDCVRVQLVSEEGSLRLPVATGHRLDPSSLRVNGEARRADETASGEPLVSGLNQGDRLDYRTGPASAPASYRPRLPGPPPMELVRMAAGLDRLDLHRRVEEAKDRVARRIAYDRSDAASGQHLAEVEALGSFAEAALKIGKGDCDVQNGVLVLLLRQAGVTARLAVGYVGHGGQVALGLHAWVEYLDAERQWRTADVSPQQARAGSSPIAWVTRGSGGAAARVGGPALAPGWIQGVSGLEEKAWPGTWMGLAVIFGASALAFSALAFWAFGWVPAFGWGPMRRQPSADGLRLGETDLAALLGGALQHEGLARLPALLHGRFVPLIAAAGSRHLGGGRQTAISLHQAERRASRGELFSSTNDSRLAREAAERGWPVIDAGQAEGRVTSLGLGAIDLDEWSDLLDRSTDSGLVGHLNEYLASIGEDWRLALVSPLGQPLRVVDLGRLGLGRRQVLIDPGSIDFAGYGPRLDPRSDVAAFRLLDAVADHLDLTRADRGELLSELARRAILEEHGR